MALSLSARVIGQIIWTFSRFSAAEPIVEIRTSQTTPCTFFHTAAAAAAFRVRCAHGQTSPCATMLEATTSSQPFDGPSTVHPATQLVPKPTQLTTQLAPKPSHITTQPVPKPTQLPTHLVPQPTQLPTRLVPKPI